MSNTSRYLTSRRDSICQVSHSRARFTCKNTLKYSRRQISECHNYAFVAAHVAPFKHAIADAKSASL